MNKGWHTILSYSGGHSPLGKWCACHCRGMWAHHSNLVYCMGEGESLVKSALDATPIEFYDSVPLTSIGIGSGHKAAEGRIQF